MTAGPDPLRILLAEDQPEQVELLQLYLQMEGHNVDAATNGQEAFAMFDNKAHGLVVTNHAMPLMNGEKLAAEIKQKTPWMPIILVTGFGPLFELSSRRHASPDVVLAKPLTSDQLLASVKQLT